ncbi:MAG: dihydrofolate reductase [Corynebacterium sp.]|uniref:dihydrofolate reductase n=1 Tax=Corynebacterium sp. TaxID=1720 RepID=UPI0026DA7695|nr:dihydrofolate reductase [Corynebacterium sp.]MDO4762044.1 dihydrofolate reductase [Corynebacterium sp.]
MLKAIWAQNRAGVIGDGEDMPWHVPEDLAHFKKVTLGEPVIMGRRTWESLPLKPLPGRENFVLSSRAPGAWSQGATVIDSVPKAGWIIGGGQVYAATLGQVSRIERTLIDVDTDLGSRAVYAPEIPDNFVLESESEWMVSTSGVRYQFQTWVRSFA